MPWCPSCRSEFRAGFDRCAECDRPLVETLVPPAPPIATGDLTPLCEGPSMEEAECIAGALEAEGIESCLENENAPFLAIGLPTSVVPLRVLVREADLARAREVLAALTEARRAQRSADPPAPVRRRGVWIAVILGCFALSMHPLLAGHADLALSAFMWGLIALSILAWMQWADPSHVVPGRRLMLYGVLGGLAAGALSLAPLPRGWHPIAQALFVIGPVEELAKVLAVLLPLIALRSPRPIEWMAACAASGAGFGLLENMLHTLAGYAPTQSLMVMRSATVLLHLYLSAFVGFAAGRGGRFIGVAGAWLAVSLVHGIWDALIFARLEALWLIFATGVLTLMAFTMRPMVRALVMYESRPGPA